MKKIFKVISFMYLLLFVQIISVSAQTYSINDEDHGSYDVVPDYYYVLGTHMYSDLTKIDYLEIIEATNTSNEESPIIYQKLFGDWYDFDGDEAEIPNNDGLICISSIDGKDLSDSSCAGTALSVTFEGSTQESNPKVDVLVGQKLSAADVPTPQTKRGYKFVCWIDNDLEDYQDESSCYDFSKSVSKNVTLKPYYEAITYTIKFDLNGLESSTANTDTQKCNLEALGDCKLPVLNEARKGYTFDGWSSVKDANGDQGTHFEGGASMVDMLGESNEITLYAVWKPQTYTITYNLNGGTYENLTILKSSYDILTKDGIDLFTPSRIGYTFDGWDVADNDSSSANVSETGDGTKKYSLTITDVKDLSLTAKWKANEYTITYDLGLDSEEESRLLQTTASDEDLDTPSNTTCNFEDGCTLADAPDREDYIFAGWADDDGYLYSENKLYKGIDFEDENFTLTAQWNAKNEPLYNITYDLDGGKFTSEAMDKYGRKTMDSTLPSPTKTGYTFKGWCKDQSKSQCDNITTIKNALGKEEPEDITVYAKWEANNYTVKFYEPSELGKVNLALSVIDFEEANYQELTQEKEVQCTYDQVCALTDHSSYFANKKETLYGWSLNYGEQANNNNVYLSDNISVKNLTATDDAEVKLYAVVEEITYDITYYLDGGKFASEDSDAPTGAAKDQEITIKNPTKDGYTFTGWVDKDGNPVSTEQSNPKNESEVKIKVISDLFLIATWKQDDPEIAVTKDGKSTTSDGKITEKYKVKLTANNKKGFKALIKVTVTKDDSPATNVEIGHGNRLKNPDATFEALNKETIDKNGVAYLNPNGFKLDDIEEALSITFNGDGNYKVKFELIDFNYRDDVFASTYVLVSRASTSIPISPE